MNDEHRESNGRRDYDDANANLNRHIESNDKRLRKFFIGALIAFSIIAVATTIALIGFGIVLKNQQDTADQLERLVISNEKTSVAIQTQREESILNDCNEQNFRNEATQFALKQGSDQDQANAPNEAARAEIRRRRDVTVGLINAIAPVRDCKYLVDVALGRVEPTPVPTAVPTP